jgi:hypothetical protein
MTAGSNTTEPSATSTRRRWRRCPTRWLTRCCSTPCRPARSAAPVMPRTRRLPLEVIELVSTSGADRDARVRHGTCLGPVGVPGWPTGAEFWPGSLQREPIVKTKTSIGLLLPLI